MKVDNKPKLQGGRATGSTVKASTNHGKVAKFIAVMLEGPATRYEIAERADLNPKPVGKLIEALKKEGICYVIDWRRDAMGRAQNAVFSLGSGTDAPRKKPTEQTDRSRKSYLNRLAKQTKEQRNPKTTFVAGCNPWEKA